MNLLGILKEVFDDFNDKRDEYKDQYFFGASRKSTSRALFIILLPNIIGLALGAIFSFSIGLSETSAFWIGMMLAMLAGTLYSYFRKCQDLLYAVIRSGIVTIILGILFFIGNLFSKQ